MFGIEEDFKQLMEQFYGPLNKDKMTDEIDISKVLIEGDTATIMGVKYKRIEEPKTPVEEAFKRVYGHYPVSDINDTCWDGSTWEDFQAGYKSAQKDYKVGEWEPTPQTPEQVADGLKEAFREAVKQGVVSSTKSPTLYDICREWCDDDENPPVSVLIDRIDKWLPTEHDTNSYKWNECIRMIREKLR